MATTETLLDLSSIEVAIPDHVLFQHLDGEAVLLDVRSGGYFGLNGVGTFVWQKFASGSGLDAIIEALQADYEVDKARSNADIQVFLLALQSQGLVILNAQAE